MNIRECLLCLCLTLISFGVFAQSGNDKKIYSQYLRETKNLKADTNIVDPYLKFAKLIDQPDTALAIIDKGMKLLAGLNCAKGDYLFKKLRAEKALVKYNREIKKLKEDTNKVSGYLKIVVLIEPFFRDTALFIAKKAKGMARKLNYERGIELSIYWQGALAEKNNELTLAIDYYREAAKVAESHKTYPADISGKYPEIYEIYNSCLNIYYYRADYPNAMDIAQKGLAVAEQLNDKPNQAHYDNQVGFIYLKQEKADESIKYYNQYLKLANEIHNRMMVADACNGTADGYLLKKDYKTSLFYYFKALNIYHKMKEWPNGLEEEKFDGTRRAFKSDRTAYTLFKISSVYKQAGNYKMALQYSKQIFDIFDKRKREHKGLFNKYDLAGYYINAGDIYRLLKDYKQAGAFLNQGLSLAKSIVHREDMRDAYDALSKNFAAQKQYDSAYIYSTLYTRLKDSIINEESLTKITAIQARYDTEKKDREVALLLLVAVLFLFYSRYLLKQKNKYQSQVNKQQTVLFNAVVSAQDNERKRIAQDIHDSLGSVLSAAKLNLSGLEDSKKKFTSTQKEKYEIALTLLDDASAELRNISHNLMPATLLKLGLTAALQNLFDKISATGMQINFTAHEIKERLNETLEISIYRIILELVNNIVKHAKATEVTVQLIKYPSYINITVEDNGRGFIYKQIAAETKGMGLSSIRSRIEYLKGTMDIDSGKGTGTTVIIDIPLEGNTNVMV